MSGMNPFQNNRIVETLGQVCSFEDKDTLKKLRELSTPYNNTLSKSYYDLIQIQLSFDMRTKRLRFSLSGGPKRRLKLDNRDPVLAPTIRVLQVTGTYDTEFDTTPASFQNMNIYDLLLHQLFPHITTLKIYGALKASGLIVELKLDFSFDEDDDIYDYDTSILTPASGLKDFFHRVSLSQEITPAQFPDFVQLVTENQAIISSIHLSCAGDVNQNLDLENARAISPFVCNLVSPSWPGELLISSVFWPKVTNLKLYSLTKQLPDLSTSFPNLHTFKIGLSIGAEQEDVFFSNSENTKEQALETIFGGCAKT